MNVVIGLIFITMVVLVCLGWVAKLGRIGLMMIGIAICVPAAMGCVLDLRGRQRLWGIAPVAVFFVLVVLIFREWNRTMKK